jgi:uroporphyrinogen decarboxylase
MNSRERVLTALEHKEPDRIPFDVGGANTTIHVKAYRALRDYLGLPKEEIQLLHQAGQIARLDEDFLELLKVDTRFVAVSKPMSRGTANLRDEGDYLAFTDSWGVGWRTPKINGLYYDMYQHPLAGPNVEELLKTYAWPSASNPTNYEGQLEMAREIRAQDKAGILGGYSAGPFEKFSWLRGFVDAFTDFALNPELVKTIMDKIVGLKVEYWERALSQVGEYIDVVFEGDDVAGQDRLLISPKIYREILKPRHKEIFQAIKKAAPHVKIHFHTCGAIRPLIPDLIEIGVDILNPVQISAAGMDPFELKKEFGKDLVFWGGGVDTQHVFSKATPQEVRDDVRRNIDALAPGGGFIFNTVHNTQADVPPENFMAMWETLQEYGVYQ